MITYLFARLRLEIRIKVSNYKTIPGTKERLLALATRLENNIRKGKDLNIKGK